MATDLRAILAQADGLATRAERMLVRASSAKKIDALLAVTFALREFRKGLAPTPPTDEHSLHAIEAQLAKQAARLEELDIEQPRRED